MPSVAVAMGIKAVTLTECILQIECFTCLQSKQQYPARQTGLPLLTEEITEVERFDLPAFAAGVKGTAGWGLGLGWFHSLRPFHGPCCRQLSPAEAGGKHPAPAEPGTLSPLPGRTTPWSGAQTWIQALAPSLSVTQDQSCSFSELQLSHL